MVVDVLVLLRVLDRLLRVEDPCGLVGQYLLLPKTSQQPPALIGPYLATEFRRGRLPSPTYEEDLWGRQFSFLAGQVVRDLPTPGGRKDSPQSSLLLLR